MTSNTLAAKDPDVAAIYSIDWHDQLVQEAKRDFTFETTGVYVQPQFGTGFYYECTTAGRTAKHYPARWPRAAGETVQDGSVVWTARAPGAAIPSVQSASWTVPSGLTLDSQQELGSVTYITLSDGTDGEDYEVLCRMTPTSGPVMEQTIIIPVRAQ